MPRRGLVQSLKRDADKLRTHYDQLITDLRASAAVFADETSWYVGLPRWWLRVFANPKTAVFRVEPHRDAELVRRTLGPDFSGMMVGDCLAVYESLGYRRQTGQAHHLRAIASAEAIAGATTPEYLRRWELLASRPHDRSRLAKRPRLTPRHTRGRLNTYPRGPWVRVASGLDGGRVGSPGRRALSIRPRPVYPVSLGSGARRIRSEVGS